MLTNTLSELLISNVSVKLCSYMIHKEDNSGQGGIGMSNGIICDAG